MPGTLEVLNSVPINTRGRGEGRGSIDDETFCLGGQFNRALAVPSQVTHKSRFYLQEKCRTIPSLVASLPPSL